MKFSPRRLALFPPCLLLASLALAEARPLAAAELFSALVGQVKVGPVRAGGVLEVPYITWGGDVATFHANGGLATRPGTIFHKQGLNLKLVAGDDFPAQVKRYLAGESPFLRGTTSMLGMASEVTGADPRTKPVVFLQLTWSQGDHMVGRGSIKTLSDLKGKKVALQQGGPHVGMLDDILRSAQLSWKDINVVWANALTGESGPAALFRKDASVDACMVISPDMIGLTSGLQETGTGAEGTVAGARVVVSTFTMNRSIADVYACRKDFYDSNRAVVEKLAAGYLKGCEEVVAAKKDYREKGASPVYSAVLKLTQEIYGADVIPNEAEADGLISDCEYVHLSGNKLFFTDPGFLRGFERKEKEALDLAVELGYARTRSELIQHDFDYAKITSLGGLTKTQLAEASGFNPSELEEEGTILSFTIEFEPEQPGFSVKKYEAEFQRVVDGASLYGNAVFSIRGHADPSRTLMDLVMAGTKKGILKRTGTQGDYKYFIDGKPLDLAQTARIVELIEKGSFNGTDPDPSQTMQAALNLSQRRAEEVMRAIIEYARSKRVRLNEDQLQAVGDGIKEPIIPKPRNPAEAAVNRRVEFRLLRVRAEAIQASEFDF
jgi:ABC-type nitrate/sulfonate/bicarbonate transport system substrate-binding protein